MFTFFGKRKSPVGPPIDVKIRVIVLDAASAPGALKAAFDGRGRAI
jgi:hypothetical protein